MASAGRILIMPKGDYDASVTYEALDLVHYNDTAWLAKKTVVGIEPSNANSEYWFKFAVINTQDYLSTAGGKLRGMLGVGGGKGVINGNDYGAILQSFIDDNNYRGVRVDNPLQASDTEHWLKLIDCVDGTIYQYKVFGEHNIDFLKKSVFTTKTYSGTTDENGFLKPKDITVDKANIVSCGIVNGVGFCTPFNDTDAHWSFKFENWDRTPVSNKLATVKVIYMSV